jgi:hypothetical protein
MQGFLPIKLQVVGRHPSEVTPQQLAAKVRQPPSVRLLRFLCHVAASVALAVAFALPRLWR